MAWTSNGTLGSNQSKTADQATLVLTTTAVAAAAKVVVVAVAVDNNNSVETSENCVSTVTDSAGGNTWIQIQEWMNPGSGAAQAGVAVSLWYSLLTNQIASSGTITATFTATTSRDAAAITAWLFDPGAGAVISIAATSALISTGIDPGAISIGGTPTTITTDDFTRANETPIASPWVNTQGSLRLASNAVEGNVAVTNNLARSGTNIAADGWVQGTIVDTGSNIGVLFRHSVSAADAYCLLYSSGGVVLQLAKFTAGVPTVLKSISPFTAFAGDILRLEVIGGTLTGYVSSSLSIAVADATFAAAGQAGIFVNDNTVAIGIDTFLAGEFSAIDGLFLHVLGAEGANTDAYTWDADYTQFDGNGTTGAGAASNIHVRGGFRIANLATDTVDVTSTTGDRDYAQVMAILKIQAGSGGGGGGWIHSQGGWY